MRVSLQRPRAVVVLLAVCVALTFIGQTMPYPVIAPWLAAHQQPMGSLGWLSFAFSLGNLLGAPVAGGLVDRWGRRPMLLIGLLTIVLTNLMIPFFDSFPVFVLLRFALGLGNAGVMPAAIAITADMAPAEERAKWIGMVTGGISVGLIIGPSVGGVLYDAAGFAAPFAISALMAGIAALLVQLFVPETRGTALQATHEHVGMLEVLRNPPRPLALLLVLFWVDFLWVFTWVATEPAMLSHLYGDHGYTATMFGVTVASFGLATAVVQLVAGGLSDRYGRLVLIAVGMLLNAAWYFGVAQLSVFGWVLVCSLISGVGAGLVTPALGAAYVDMTDPSQRGRVAALKEMVVAIGGMVGPLSSIYLTNTFDPVNVLDTTAAVIVLTALVVAASIPFFAAQRRRSAA